MFFCFKQMPAFHMRISGWSSDVCSSDLPDQVRGDRDDMRTRRGRITSSNAAKLACIAGCALLSARSYLVPDPFRPFMMCGRGGTGRRATLRSLWPKGRGSSSILDRTIIRSEERRGGQEGVSTCRSRWSPDNEKKKKKDTKN